MTYSNSILLIGNGPSAIEHPYGEIIDTFGIVCRCNNFIIKKYEKFVGTKTDIFFRRPCNNVTDHSPEAKKTVLCVTHRIKTGKALLRSALSMRKRLSKEHTVEVYSGEPVERLSKDMGLDFKTESATVGAIAMHYILNHMKMKPLYIHGFDYIKENWDNGLHYFPKKGSGMALHSRDKEQDWVAQLINDGLVIRLTDIGI